MHVGNAKQLRQALAGADFPADALADTGILLVLKVGDGLNLAGPVSRDS